MKSLTEDDFLGWAEDRDLAVGAGYPRTAILEFRPPSDQARFWCVPDRPERRPYFISSILELAEPWATCFAWRHCGSWPSEERLDRRRINDNVEFELLRGIGIPLGTADVLEFHRDDRGGLVSLLFVASIYGWSVGKDLYVVPDSARYILKMSHHNVIHVKFRDGGDIGTWVSEMTERGFPLPDAPPDESVKRPSWMASRPSR